MGIPLPSWLVNILINLAMKLGIPWLISKFPGLPAELWTLIEDVISHVHGKDNPAAAVAQLRTVMAVNGVKCRDPKVCDPKVNGNPKL